MAQRTSTTETVTVDGIPITIEVKRRVDHPDEFEIYCHVPANTPVCGMRHTKENI